MLSKRTFLKTVLSVVSCSAASWAPIGRATAQTAVNDGFLPLAGGRFLMGSPARERQRQDDETQHAVILSPFYMDPHEVRQRDYEALMGTNPSRFRGEDFPVENVTWYEAVEYCNRLSRARGLREAYQIDGMNVTWDRTADGYRLPTEAEWEYAARAGTSTVFNLGDHITSQNVNFEGDYPYLIEENYTNRQNPNVVTGPVRGSTVAVGSFSPNAFGLYNMHGNVSEWCFDYYGAYSADGSRDPTGPERGYLRINRGGSFLDFAKHLRSAYRSATNPMDRDGNLGFRLVRGATSGRMASRYEIALRETDNPRILIAYYSYSGNTENAAQILRRLTGADLVEIAMQRPYRGNIYDVSQADLNGNVRPALTTRVDNMADYDIVLLGYPTWWATLPMPVVTFLTSYDFKGKTILPFSSHGGTEFGDSHSDLAKLTPGTLIAPGFGFTYSGGRRLDERLAQWLRESGVRVQ